jgi:hypothetical protein
VAFNDPVDTLPASAITGQIQGSQLAADSIDGKTITGALIRTGTAPTARLEMGPVALGVPQLTGYTGDTRESTPGELAFTRPSHAQLAGDQMTAQLSAGVYPIGGITPALVLLSEAFDGSILSSAGLQASTVQITGLGGIVLSGPVQILNGDLSFLGAHRIQLKTTAAALTYVAPFQNYGAVGAPLGNYDVDAMNRVRVQGAVANPTTAFASGATIATGLPAPSDGCGHSFTVWDLINGVARRVDVTATGSLVAQWASGAGDIFSLAGIIYQS